jgi:glycyl-tRNA synthetase beta chain
MEFARPVHWVVLMYGEETGFGKVLGIESGSVSRGHRFHAPQEISLKRPEDYVEQLRQARVITDFHERCGIIRDQVAAAAGELGATALVDEDLLEEVAAWWSGPWPWQAL